MAAGWTPDQPGQAPAGARASERTIVNAGRLWAGGLATAVIAALIAVVGIVVSRGVFDVAVLAPHRAGTWGDANTVTYAVGAFCFALLATGAIHLLLIATPSPFTFFGWIMALCTLVGAVSPFATTAQQASQISTALINVVIGLAVWSLTASSAHRSVRRGWA